MRHALCGSCFRRVVPSSSIDRHRAPTIDRGGRRCCGCAFVVAVFYEIEREEGTFVACLHTGWDVRPSPGGAA